MNWKEADGLSGHSRFWTEPQQGNPGNDPVLSLSQQRESAVKEEFRGRRTWSWKQGLISSGGVAQVIQIPGLSSSGSHHGVDWDLTEYTDVVWYDDTDHTQVWPLLTFTVDPTALTFNAFYQDRYWGEGTGVPTAFFTLEWVTSDLTVVTSVNFYKMVFNYSISAAIEHLDPYNQTVNPTATGVRMRSDLHTGKCDSTYYDQSIEWAASFDIWLTSI
jgi:hypothetical protein